MIRDKVQSKVAKAFDTKLADAVRSFSGEREESGEYVPGQGTNPVTVRYSGRGVFGSFKAEELAPHIEATDTKLTALQNELTLDSDGSPATPQVDDIIAGQTVKSVRQDPASATWTLALRKSGG